MTAGYVIRGPEGTITVSAGAQAEIVRRAVERVGGARLRRPRRGLDLELADGRGRVALELSARLGLVLPDLARQVQESVADALGAMCEVQVDVVDVAIEELDT